MADEIDISNERVDYATRDSIRNTPKPVILTNINPRMVCWFCDEPTKSNNHRWCSTQCADDWDYEQSRKV
jgi:hypothetical protein